VLQDRDARASELDALAGEAVTGSGAAAAPAADEGGRKRSSRCDPLFWAVRSPPNEYRCVCAAAFEA
jgi:hypothetical protein